MSKMASPTNNDNPTAKAGAAEFTTDLPTVAGRIPPELQGRFRAAQPTNCEFARLPSPRGRCAISGASRSWLNEHDAFGHFLIRVRQKGRTRSTVFVDVAKLRAYIRAHQAANEAERRTDGMGVEP